MNTVTILKNQIMHNFRLFSPEVPSSFFSLVFCFFLVQFYSSHSSYRKKNTMLTLIPSRAKRGLLRNCFKYKCYGSILFSHIIKEKIFCINEFFTQLKHFQKHILFILILFIGILKQKTSLGANK